MAREGPRYREFLIYPLIFSNKLAYLQLTTVSVYGIGPLKSHKQDYVIF